MSGKNNHINSLESDLKVIYEDNHVLVVVKPHRLLIQSDHSGSPTLFLQICGWLKEKYQKPGNVFLGMVHRLDRPASGLLVFAKTSKAASRLSEQIRNQEMEKHYQVIVEGKPDPARGTCIHYLGEPAEGRSEVFQHEKQGAKRAELHYQTLETKEHLSLIEVELVTGRRHQIRAQMSHLGHPIVGDGRYGSHVKYLEGSIALVASRIRFKHPTTLNDLQFELPDELNSIREFWNAQ